MIMTPTYFLQEPFIFTLDYPYTFFPFSFRRDDGFESAKLSPIPPWMISRGYQPSTFISILVPATAGILYLYVTISNSALS